MMTKIGIELDLRLSSRDGAFVGYHSVSVVIRRNSLDCEM